MKEKIMGKKFKNELKVKSGIKLKSQMGYQTVASLQNWIINCQSKISINNLNFKKRSAFEETS